MGIASPLFIFRGQNNSLRLILSDSGTINWIFVWYPSIFNEKPLRYLDFVHFSDASFARFQSLQRRCCIIRFFLTCSLSVFTTESAELTEARNARFYLFSLRALCSLWLLIALYPVTYRTAELCNNALCRCPTLFADCNIRRELLVNQKLISRGVGNPTTAW